MPPRIGFISASYPLSVFETAKIIAQNLGITLITKMTSTEKAIEDTKSLMRNDKIELIISRGRTADKIKEVLNIPLLLIEVYPEDILHALINLKHSNHKIGIIAYQMATCKIENYIKYLKQITQLDINIINYTSPHSFRYAFEKAFENNIDLIIGSSFAVEEARKAGFSAIEILPTEETLSNILNQAKQIINVKRNEEKQVKMHSIFFETINEGIITVNQNGIVTDINQKALDILDVNYQRIHNRNIVSMLPDVKNIIASGKVVNGLIIDINNKKYAFNFQPVNVEKKYTGGILTMQTVTTIQKLEYKIREQSHNKGLYAKVKLDQIIGKSKNIMLAKNKALKYAKTEFNVLIEGESGTGKELFAQGIHLASTRPNGPFVAVNCAAIPDNLLESELFGYDEGAFTGAKKGGKIGLFELAHNGTIFLDEIGSMSYSLQNRLLRIIQEKEIMRVGGSSVIPINTRIIAASNVPLYENVQKHVFRNDLYFRINELNLKIPPLRERRDDIPLLCKYFLEVHLPGNKQNINYKIINSELDKAMSLLTYYQWPGNVRELENITKRIIVLIRGSQNESLSYDQLIDELTVPNFQQDESKIDNNHFIIKKGTMEEMKDELIYKTYTSFKGNKSAVSDYLDISRATLWRRLKDMSLDENTNFNNDQ